MLASGSGDESAQFVELLAVHHGSYDEWWKFFTPFHLVVYGPDGKELGEQTLDAMKMAAASGNRPYLVSTAAADTALSTQGDEPLTINLPHAAGQLCFTQHQGDDKYNAYFDLNCMSWGCITNYAEVSSEPPEVSAVPGDGLSTQLRTYPHWQIAPPTPKALNTDGTSAPACKTPPAPTPFAGVVIPKQTAKVKKGKAPVLVRCPVKTKESCTGTIKLKTAKKVKTRKGKKRVVALGHARFFLYAGDHETYSVPLTAEGKFQVAHHKVVRSVATAKAHDAAGKSKTTSGHVRLRK